MRLLWLSMTRTPRFVTDTPMCSMKHSITLGNNLEFIHPDCVAQTSIWSPIYHVIAEVDTWKNIRRGQRMTNSIYAATKGEKDAAFSGSYLTNLFLSLLDQHFARFLNGCQTSFIQVLYLARFTCMPTDNGFKIIEELIHICYVEASSTRQTSCLWLSQTEFVSALKETMQPINSRLFIDMP